MAGQRQHPRVVTGTVPEKPCWGILVGPAWHFDRLGPEDTILHRKPTMHGEMLTVRVRHEPD
jgi:hypothetical protein